MDLQSHLLFRIVTREVDTSGTLQPINVYWSFTKTSPKAR
jgi:hypothetical protein